MIGHTNCCGLKEIADIHHDWLNTGPRGVMRVLANSMLHPLERWIPDPKNPGRKMNNPQERPFYPRCCHLFFTDHHDLFKMVGRKSIKVRYGKQFAKYILKNKLGKLTCSSRAVNPNSRHTITVWVWTFDAKRLKKHLEAEFPWQPKPDPVPVPPPSVAVTSAGTVNITANRTVPAPAQLSPVVDDTYTVVAPGLPPALRTTQEGLQRAQELLSAKRSRNPQPKIERPPAVPRFGGSRVAR